jgi:hypothetical protein
MVSNQTGIEVGLLAMKHPGSMFPRPRTSLAGSYLASAGPRILSFAVRVFESSTTWCEVKYADISLLEAHYFRTGELAR